MNGEQDDDVAVTVWLPKPPPGHGPVQYGPQEARPHVCFNPSSGEWCEFNEKDDHPRFHAYKLKPMTVKAWTVVNDLMAMQGMWYTKESAENHAKLIGGTVIELTGQYTPGEAS